MQYGPGNKYCETPSDETGETPLKSGGGWGVSTGFKRYLRVFDEK